MPRRGIVFLILVIGVGAALALYRIQRSYNKDSISNQKTSDSLDSVVHTQDPVKKPLATPATRETSSSSMQPVPGKLPGRGMRHEGQPVPGQKSYDVSGLQTIAHPFFAGSSWKILSGVTAYRKNQGEPRTAGKRLGEVNGFYLVDEGASADIDQFYPERPIVIIQTGSGQVGVVTGVFGVELEEGTSPDFLTQSMGLKIVGAFPQTHTYFVTSSQSPFSLQELQTSLKEAPEVKEVHMEILDRQYEKF